MTGPAAATIAVGSHCRWRRLLGGMAVAGAVVGVAACGSGRAETSDTIERVSTTTTEAAESTTTTAEVTTTTVPPTEEEIVVQTVEDMWLMLKTVSAAPDPDNPELARYLTGEQLERSTAAMAEWQSKNQAAQDGPNGKWEHRPVLVSLTDSEAVVSDCAIDDTWLMEIDSDGTPVALLNGDEVVESWTVSLEKADGLWRVSSLERIDAWYSGDPGCTADW